MLPVAEVSHLLGDVRTARDEVRADQVLRYGIGRGGRPMFEQPFRFIEERGLRALEAKQVVQLQRAHDVRILERARARVVADEAKEPERTVRSHNLAQRRWEVAHLVRARRDGDGVDARLRRSAHERARDRAEHGREVLSVALRLPLRVHVIAAREGRALAVHHENAEGQRVRLESLTPVRCSNLRVESAAKLARVHLAEHVAQRRIRDATRNAERSPHRTTHLGAHILELRQASNARADAGDHRAEKDPELPATASPRPRVGDVAELRFRQSGGKHARQPPVPSCRIFHRFLFELERATKADHAVGCPDAPGGIAACAELLTSTVFGSSRATLFAPVRRDSRPARVSSVDTVILCAQRNSSERAREFVRQPP